MFYNRRVALAHPDAHSPEYRLLSFDMTAECHGTQLAGNNIQVVLGAPDQLRVGLEEDVVMWLASHWWVVLRNKFAGSKGCRRGFGVGR
jgi:hypothetical protein